MKLIALLSGVACLSVCSEALDVERLPRAPAPSPTFTASGIPPPCNHTAFAIPNGDFENGLAGWSIDALAGSTVRLVSPGSNNSQYAAELSRVRGKYAPDLTSPYWYPCTGELFAIDFDFMVPYTTPSCILKVLFSEENSPANYMLTQRPWTHRTIFFSGVTQGKDSITCLINCYQGDTANATVMVDNFTLSRRNGTSEPKGCPRTQIPVTNGGFEMGNFSNWSVLTKPNNINFEVVSPGRGPSSKYMFQADVGPFAPLNYSTQFIIQHPVQNACEGYNYTYAFDYRLQNYDTVNYPDYCTLQFNDDYCWRSLTDPTTAATNLTLTDAWKHQEINCTSVQSGPSSAEFFLECGGDGTGPVYNFTQFNWNLDNFVVRYDPPPPQ